MAPITWQNVNGARLTNNADTLLRSGIALNHALNGFGDDLSSFGSRQDAKQRQLVQDQIDAESKRAIAQMAQITDPNAWVQMKQNGGLTGMGFDPSMMDSTALNFFANNRDNLQRRRASDLTHYTDTYTQDRRELGDQREDQKLAMNNWARDNFRSIIGDDVLTQEDALNRVGNAQNLSEEQRQALFGHIGGMNPAYFSGSTEALEAINADPTIQRLSTDLQNRQMQINQTLAADPNMNMTVQLASGTYQPMNKTEAVSAFKKALGGIETSEGDGNIVQIIDRLKNQADAAGVAVPYSMIVDFLGNNTEEGMKDWILFGARDNVNLDRGPFTNVSKSWGEFLGNHANNLKVGQELITQQSNINKAKTDLDAGIKRATLAHDRNSQRLAKDAQTFFTQSNFKLNPGQYPVQGPDRPPASTNPGAQAIAAAATQSPTVQTQAPTLNPPGSKINFDLPPNMVPNQDAQLKKVQTDLAQAQADFESAQADPTLPQGEWEKALTTYLSAKDNKRALENEIHIKGLLGSTKNKSFGGDALKARIALREGKNPDTGKPLTTADRERYKAMLSPGEVATIDYLNSR